MLYETAIFESFHYVNTFFIDCIDKLFRIVVGLECFFAFLTSYSLYPVSESFIARSRIITVYMWVV